MFFFFVAHLNFVISKPFPLYFHGVTRAYLVECSSRELDQHVSPKVTLNCEFWCLLDPCKKFICFLKKDHFKMKGSSSKRYFQRFFLFGCIEVHCHCINQPQNHGGHHWPLKKTESDPISPWQKFFAHGFGSEAEIAEQILKSGLKPPTWVI